MTPSSNVEKILVQRGVLSAEALEQAVRLKERQGGSLAVNLVITGAVDDETLSSFYRERYRLDPLREEEIAAVDGATFALIPVEIVYDFGLFPVRVVGEEGMERLVVGMIDPSEPEVLEEAAFFAALELAPRLMTIGQMARHYARLTGKRWKVDWETVVARRRIYQAGVQAGAESIDEPPSADGAIILTNPVMELLDQTEALDHSLNNIFDADDGDDDGRSELVIALVSIDENNLEAEEVIELTRVKNRAVSAMPGKVSLEEADRPRVKRKGRGENRWILDPAEEGEVRIKGADAAVRTPDELPKIIVDTALLSPEEAEARVTALEQELIAPAPGRRKTAPAQDLQKKPIEEIPSNWLESVESQAPVDEVASPKTLPLGSPVGGAQRPDAPGTREPVVDTAPADTTSDGWPEPAGDDLRASAAASPAGASEPGPEEHPVDAGIAHSEPEVVEAAPDATDAEAGSVPDQLPPRASSATRPGPASGLTFQLDPPDETPPASQGFADALEDARERDEVGIAVAAFLRETYERVILWTLRTTQASAWIVHASNSAEASPDRTPIEVGEVEVLARATGATAYLGPVGATRAEAVAAMESLLGGGLPLSAVSLPIHIGERQIGLIYCDNGPGEAVVLDKGRLALVHRELDNALHRVILLRKRRRRH